MLLPLKDGTHGHSQGQLQKPRCCHRAALLEQKEAHGNRQPHSALFSLPYNHLRAPQGHILLSACLYKCPWLVSLPEGSHLEDNLAVPFQDTVPLTGSPYVQ